MSQQVEILSAYPNRRIFLRNKEEFFKLFSFVQNSDGSIYVGWPGFSDTDWCSVELTSSGGVKPIRVDSIPEGKLSIHGSGITAFRAHNTPGEHQLRIKGSQLLNVEKGQIGARHLFTFFSKKPVNAQVDSPPFNRRSDYVIDTKEFEPSVTLFFAIPQVPGGLQSSFQVSFSMDDLKTIPPSGGGGHFNLLHHDIFWYTYTTKYMDDWPRKNQVFYYDGFLVPIMIGTGRGAYRLELRMPQYSLQGNLLSIIV